MGYEVRITRKAQWFENNGADISLREWMDYVASDPEMRAEGHAEAETAHGVVRIDDEGIAVWMAYPSQGAGGQGFATFATGLL